MKLSSYYPVIAVDDVAVSTAFYKKHFGFVAAFETDWYVHLTLPNEDGAGPVINLAILDANHQTIPEGYRLPAQGVLLNFETEDVDNFYQAMKNADVAIIQALRDEDFGQRHFIMRDPQGVMIDVIKPIPPNAEFASDYSAEALPH